MFGLMDFRLQNFRAYQLRDSMFDVRWWLGGVVCFGPQNERKKRTTCLCWHAPPNKALRWLQKFYVVAGGWNHARGEECGSNAARREEAFGNEGDLETWIRTEERNPGYMGVKYGLGSNTRYLQANDWRPTDIGWLFRKPWNHPH